MRKIDEMILGLREAMTTAAREESDHRREMYRAQSRMEKARDTLFVLEAYSKERIFNPIWVEDKQDYTDYPRTASNPYDIRLYYRLRPLMFHSATISAKRNALKKRDIWEVTLLMDDVGNSYRFKGNKDPIKIEKVFRTEIEMFQCVDQFKKIAEIELAEEIDRQKEYFEPCTPSA